MTFFSRLRLAAAAVILVAPSAFAAPRGNGTVPVLDVKSSCGEAQRFSTQGNDKGIAFKSCMDSEMKARDQIAERWSSFKSSDRQTCVEQARAPVPSYVEVLTCLEMASGLFRTDSMNSRSGGGLGAKPALTR